MKRYIILFIISTLIASVLLQCEKQENIDYSKELRWTTYTTSDGLVSNNVHAIAIDNEGNKWFGAPWGVSKFDGNTWTTYTKLDGLADNYVGSIAIDKEGNKWFVTHGVGVSKFDGNTWTTYTTSDGLASNHVISIAIDNEGNKWFGTNEGVSKFDGNTWTNYMISDGVSLNNVYRIAGDKKGNMWFLTDGSISKFDGRKWTNYKFPNYPTSSESFCDLSFSDKDEYCSMPAIDAQDNLWVVRGFEHYESGCGGDICPSWYWSNIMFFDGKKWRTVYGDCPSEVNYFFSFSIDKENNKWFGTNQGVKKLSN
jgi:ligand-binding sensor domain-containing protein